MPIPAAGTRVLVPLGKKECIGIVDNTPVQKDEKIALRPMIGPLDEEPLVSEVQLDLWHWIATYYMCPIGDVLAAALPAKALDKTYSLNATPRRTKRPDYTTIEPIPLAELNAPQQRALEQIQEQWQSHEVVLLHGVTSSGKTEVYTHFIDKILQSGKNVLYLVPEIALTTQLTSRLAAHFGSQLVVYHSRVTDAQRMEIYRSLLQSTSQPQLILGARSAVFLPLTNLGLVIIDEEHEPSYKQQDPAPRYHARSVAIMAAHSQHAKVLLGTATPAVETYYNAQTGKYGLVTLSERYAGLALPSIHLIDLQRQYHRKEMYEHFSDPLVEQIRTALAEHKQVILFQNRRGYAPFVQCTACGQPPRCPNCDVSLTVHLSPRQLVCHYCGHTIPMPTVCPDCGGEMKIHGFGTERIEEEVHKLFPEAKVARMDLDTTRRKDDYQHIIDAFSNHEVDILIGTQMVTKGLHFDDVSLVAVLQADQMVAQPDFRSAERAFQLLEQVAGRAGRKGTEGQVFIQTFDPENAVFSQVQQHDYLALYNHEIAERKTFKYPPFHRIIEVTVRHTDSAKTEAAAYVLQQLLSQCFGSRCSVVLLPAVSRVNRYYIRNIRLRVETTASFANAKQRVMQHIDYVRNLPNLKSIQILLNVDPL
ncbi:MAG: primosomal protein N' [Paludibacteraceae bacterium]|nr:primosomal protein N' [Paludibacteraceae bacterium]